VEIVGIALVRNEDVFVGQAIRNVAPFCDRLFVVDHMSTDETWPILRALTREYDHLDVRRARNAAVSHQLVEGYAGSDTWVFRIDGDELYDPAGLTQLRDELLAGAYGRLFRLAGNALNCAELDLGNRVATGWLAPPSRPGISLYNFAALDSWTGCPERLHAGTRTFRSGYRFESSESLGERLSWEESPLRCLHVCFLRRSSLDPERPEPRPNLTELDAYRRDAVGAVVRALRRRLRRRAGPEGAGSPWKEEKYRRGERVSRDAAPFLAGWGEEQATALLVS
jgi:glycosyltransferase involved in cell wall biosynthesis